MFPNDFVSWGTVVVQGQPVTITPETVNEFFGLPDMLEVAGGWEEHEFFKAYNYDLASAIRTDGNGWWHARNEQRLNPTVAVGDAQEQEQDPAYQDDAPQEQGQPQGEDRILVAITDMRASLEGRMDVMEAGMISLEAKLTNRIDAMEARMERINSTLFQIYARRQAGPSWTTSTLP
ncbi:hypothetical protein ACOSQ2_003055 [Xanthoceras sorbifolium]